MLIPLFLLAGPASCQLTLRISEAQAATYRVALIIPPACPPDRVFRVRKSSTLNVKRDGAPYQPIKPTVGAWEISRLKSTVPRAELSGLNTWRWEVWDKSRALWLPIPIGGPYAR